jgi:hypothetical protein
MLQARHGYMNRAAAKRAALKLGTLLNRASSRQQPKMRPSMTTAGAKACPRKQAARQEGGAAARMTADERRSMKTRRRAAARRDERRPQRRPADGGGGRTDARGWRGRAPRDGEDGWAGGAEDVLPRAAGDGRGRADPRRADGRPQMAVAGGARRSLDGRQEKDRRRQAADARADGRGRADAQAEGGHDRRRWRTTARIRRR